MAKNNKTYPLYDLWKNFYINRIGENEFANVEQTGKLRAFILDLHCFIDIQMSGIIDKYIFGANPDYDIKYALNDLQLYELTFGKKISIIRKVSKEYKIKINYKFLIWLNEARNYLAHKFMIHKDSNKISYRGINLLKNESEKSIMKDFSQLLETIDDLNDKVKKKRNWKSALREIVKL